MHHAKTQVSQLNIPVPRILLNSVVHKITCPGCDAVGHTQHTLSRVVNESWEN